MYRFTIYPHSHILFKKDFQLFSSLFKSCIGKKLVGVLEIDFLIEPSDVENMTIEWEFPANLQYKLEMAFRGKQEIYKEEHALIFSFPVEDGSIVANIRGVDPYFLKKSDSEWLVEVRDTLLSEFTLIKQANIDIETGLPNLYHLFHVLHSYEKSDNLHLMLIEVYSRGRIARGNSLQSKRVTLSLKSFFNEKVLLHYIGQGIFAIVMNNQDRASLSNLGGALTSWFRSEKYKYIHIGCSNNKELQTSRDGKWEKEMLDQAWHALRISSARGPFSFCDYSLLIHPERHPLRKPPRNILAKFQRKWKTTDIFSILQLRADNPNGSLDFLDVFKSREKVAIIDDGDDIYIFLAGFTSEEASLWISENLLLEGNDPKKQISVSIGVASYPYLNFTKAETVLNCKKALLHAEFFGEGSVVLFDPVSLNISGDIFYGDGDYPNAIKEYKRGLIGDSKDINLLNSLGVAYASVNKHKESLECFKNVLLVDNDNFMALYNLGVGEELIGENVVALSRYEKAFALKDRGEEGEDIERELLFKIGMLSCLTGNYKRCIEVLLPWYKDKEEEAGARRALRYLGRSYYYGLKDYKKAMKHLQRALQFDEFDAESLGLLGIVYLDAGEGSDIALRLCEKSVELDSKNKQLRLHLTKAQIACGRLDEAKRNLRKCSTGASTRIESCYRLGRIYTEEGKHARARSWFTKIKSDKVLDKAIKKYIRTFEGEDQ